MKECCSCSCCIRCCQASWRLVSESSPSVHRRRTKLHCDRKTDGTAQLQKQQTMKTAPACTLVLVLVMSSVESVGLNPPAAVGDTIPVDSVATAAPKDATELKDVVTAAPKDATELKDVVTAVPNDTTGVKDVVTALPEDLTAMENFSFDECISKTDSQKQGECFTKPTNKMKNELNKCKCKVYKKLGMMKQVPPSKTGKKSKCKIQIPSLLEPFAGVVEAFLMPINFGVKMCFWRHMRLVENSTVQYDNFKGFIDAFKCEENTKTVLKEEIDKCNGPDAKLELPYNISYIPLLEPIIKITIGMKDFIRCNCIGNAFGKVCEDVANYDMAKIVEKFKELPGSVRSAMEAIDVDKFRSDDS